MVTLMGGLEATEVGCCGVTGHGPFAVARDCGGVVSHVRDGELTHVKVLTDDVVLHNHGRLLEVAVVMSP